MPTTTSSARMPAIRPSFIGDVGAGGGIGAEVASGGARDSVLALAAMVCSAAAGDGE
jgi:hypothetical protein